MDPKELIEAYMKEGSSDPLFLEGDSFLLLDLFPYSSIDCVVTSPPYFRKREYKEGTFGQEGSYKGYEGKLLSMTKKIHSILKDEGSFWLLLGDSYLDKTLLDLPHRIAIKMEDEQGWILKNAVVWDKLRSDISSNTDRLPSQYETLFHFTKKKDGYYYDAEAVRRKPLGNLISKGKVVTATGVRGTNYRRKIEGSRYLTTKEKKEAKAALKEALQRVKTGELSDFRMVTRGERPTGGDTTLYSGRAEELERKGYYFLYYKADGSLISDIWGISRRNEASFNSHPATFPMDLARNPIALTCPEGGIVLDPFCGSGTANLVAKLMGRRSIGIDISGEYIEIAKRRIKEGR